MRYALLGYDLDNAMDDLAAEEKRTLHRGHANLHNDTLPGGVALNTHYRFRPARQTITLRPSADDLIREEGAASTASSTLRALYLVESDNHDAVVDLARRLPPLRLGATLEIWPLTEPSSHATV